MRNEKKNLFIYVSIALLLLSIGGAIGFLTTSRYQKRALQNEKIEVVDTTKPDTVKTKMKTTTQPKKEVKEPEIEYMSKAEIEKDLQESFEEMFDVTYDEKKNAYLFMANNEGIVEDFMKTFTGMKSRESWDTMSESLRALSTTISNISGDEDVVISILNPFEPSLSALVIQNGEEKYNKMNSKGE